MAKVHQSVSPGSIPVESLFNMAGYVLNSKHSSLAPYKANRTIMTLLQISDHSLTTTVEDFSGNIS